MHVLVVEDNAINLELVRDVLEAEGYAVLTATNGIEALDLIRAEAPDLVLMDLQLPGIDGLEVTRRVRADPAIRAVPIIALTAHAMLGDNESVVAAGCDGYISKPIRLNAFRDLVAAHVGPCRTVAGENPDGAEPDSGSRSQPAQRTLHGEENEGTC